MYRQNSRQRLSKREDFDGLVMHREAKINFYRQCWNRTPIGKRPLGRPKMRWENVKKEVETLRGGPN